MPNFKYLIIGGGVAGVTAAETIRANDLNGTIAIVSDEPYLLYSRVMLSKPMNPPPTVTAFLAVLMSCIIPLPSSSERK